MYASAQALVAPMSSNTAPRSHVMRERNIAVKTRAVVKMMWRRAEKGEVG